MRFSGAGGPNPMRIKTLDLFEKRKKAGFLGVNKPRTGSVRLNPPTELIAPFNVGPISRAQHLAQRATRKMRWAYKKRKRATRLRLNKMLGK